MSPALAAGVFTTRPPGKSRTTTEPARLARVLHAEEATGARSPRRVTDSSPCLQQMEKACLRHGDPKKNKPPKKLLKNKKEGESRWSRVSPFYTRPYRRDTERRRGSADGVTTPREEPPGDGGRDGAAGLPVRGGRARTAGSRNSPPGGAERPPRPLLRSSALPAELRREAPGNRHS